MILRTTCALTLSRKGSGNYDTAYDLCPDPLPQLDAGYLMLDAGRTLLVDNMGRLCYALFAF